MKKQLLIYSDLVESPEKLFELGILSEERVKELSSLFGPINFGPSILKNDKKIIGWEVHFPTGMLFLEGADSYYRNKCIFDHVLTEEEIEELNKYSSGIVRERNEKEGFERAKKVDFDDYGGEQFYYNDDYFESLEELLDHLLYSTDENEEVFIPDYVWATKKERLINVTFEDLSGSWEDEAWEDFDERRDLKGVNEIKGALEKFNKDNEDVYIYNIDYKLAIVFSEVNKAEMRKYLEE